MVDNKNNCSRGSHGFSNGSTGSLNKVNFFLKVFVLILVILAIQCFNESFSGSVQKSSGNGVKVAERLLMDDFYDSTVSLSVSSEEEASWNSLASGKYRKKSGKSGSENELDKSGTSGNVPLCSTLDGDVQIPEEEHVSGKKRKLSRDDVYGSNVMGETTMDTMEYEENFMRQCRYRKRKEKFHKRVFRFLKKHHYIVAALLAAICAMASGIQVAIGVVIGYVVSLVFR
ncbi:hypothetical protein C922_03198 [Plasmodium inui San Antonio 1]|uniref:Transmembrane protein n=1 Tax=Plasmodium inui San Antonio 1 TaxID=1237626 RepID=W6ZZE8_9APIC|nr:hypothetical protein C922_03198 [Plasmodium inui San Antonio 1]EUD66282.1 hypothetical protein C922_03198 [Plasmodium inui San Antonio 1]